MGAELGRGGEGQVQNLHRQAKSKDLRTSSVKKDGLQETDLNEIMRKVESALAPLLWGNVAGAVNITLSRRDLKILADSDLMAGAVLSLVRSALQALPEGGTLSLSTMQVDFTYQSVLDGNHHRYGACAALAIAGRGIDGWCKLFESMLARKTGNGNYFELSTACSIIKQHHGIIRRERVAGHRTTMTVYLPLISLNGASQNAWGPPGVA